MLIDLPSSHPEVLSRMAKWGVRFESFFDVGAAEGEWGELIRERWPASDLYFFEAAPAWRPALERTARTLGGVAEVTMAAVGETDGTVAFKYDEANPYGGATAASGEGSIVVPVTSLDSFVARFGPRPPFGLKLDVHGAEQAIFAGAHEFMAECDFVVFETYNFGPASRRFGEMAVLLEEEFGLRCVDIGEPKWRAYDNALWQIDLYFVRPEGTTLAEWRL